MEMLYFVILLISVQVEALRPLSMVATSSNLLSLDGLSIKGASIASISGLRGVIATASIVPNTPIVEVDSQLVLQVTNNREISPFPSFCSQALWESLTWDARLAMKLLHLKHISKERQVWIKELPQSFTTPITWSATDIQSLQYEPIITKINKQSEKWKTLHQKWVQDSPEGGKLSYSEFLWALQCVNSRAFSGPFEGSTASERRSLIAFTGVLATIWPIAGFGTVEQSISAAFVVVASILIRDVISLKVSKLKRYVICPYVDMFNHKSNCESDASYNYFTGQFQLFTSAYAPGEQIFVSYGKQSNDRLLQYYGFIEQANPNDVYEFDGGVFDLLFKYADALATVLPMPETPAPRARLDSIYSALSRTQIQSSDDPNAANALIAAIDFKARYFRTPPLSKAASKPASVDEILASANVKRESLLSHFDEATVRCLKFFFSAEDYPQSIKSKQDAQLTLQDFNAPYSTETERKASSALKMICELELASKATTLAADEDALAALLNPTAAAAKGFSIPEGKANKAKVVSEEIVDPSGSFRDKVFATLAFRIEKKRLLAEACQLGGARI